MIILSLVRIEKPETELLTHPEHKITKTNALALISDQKHSGFFSSAWTTWNWVRCVFSLSKICRSVHLSYHWYLIKIVQFNLRPGTIAFSLQAQTAALWLCDFRDFSLSVFLFQACSLCGLCKACSRFVCVCVCTRGKKKCTSEIITRTSNLPRATLITSGFNCKLFSESSNQLLSSRNWPHNTISI